MKNIASSLSAKRILVGAALGLAFVVAGSSSAEAANFRHPGKSAVHRRATVQRGFTARRNVRPTAQTQTRRAPQTRSTVTGTNEVLLGIYGVDRFTYGSFTAISRG